MSSRAQQNSSRNRKSRVKERGSRARDHSTESARSSRGEFDSHNKGRDDGKRIKETGSKSRGAKSPRKGRDKEPPDKLASRGTTTSRKDEQRGNRSENLSQKSRESKVSGHDRHQLFQDNSRLAQLIGQITNSHDDNSRRITAAKHFYEYLYDPAHLEPVKRNSNNIFTALEDVLHERGHNELKDQIVLCLASTGHLLGIDCDKFFHWVFSKIPSASNDILRVFFLKAVAEAIKLDVGKQVFYEAMPRVMASLQDILENADSSDMLLVIMEIIGIISTDYPDVFDQYFKDTVDILVGWHIDTTQDEKLIKKTSECLTGFHPFWVADMNFSLTLLSQFLEDMEAYAEELSSISHGEYSREDTPSPFVSLPKLNALVRVYTTVVKGIGEFFIPGRGCQITVAFVNDTVSRIVKCVDISSYSFKYGKLPITANECLTVMVSYLGTHFSGACSQVAEYVIAQLKTDTILDFKHIKSLLTLLEQVVIRVGVAIPQKFIQILLYQDSPLLQLRLTKDVEVYSLLLRSLQNLLGIKNMPLVEAAYKYVVQDLKKAYEVLCKAASEDAEENIDEDITDAEGTRQQSPLPESDTEKTTEVNTNDKEKQGNKGATEDENRKEVGMSIETAVTVVCFDTTALAEIATYKSAVVGAWKVDPPTFVLLTSHIDPANWEIAKRFPAVQFCTLCTLYTHSQRCNHFLHVSGTKGGTSTSSEFEKLVKVLYKILMSSWSSIDSKRLCLLWLTDIVHTIQGMPADMQRKVAGIANLMDAVIVVSFSEERVLRREASICLQSMLKCRGFSAVSLQRALFESLSHLDDTCEDINQNYHRLVLGFPADILAGLSAMLCQSSRIKQLGNSAELTCKRDLWLAKKIHMTRPATGTLHSYQFKIIMGYLLQSRHSRNGTAWVEKIFHACQRLGKVQTPVSGDYNSMERFGSFTDSTLPFNGRCSESLLWFWATWEAAQFCLLSRLKTPLGKAMETFQAFEGAIKDFVAELQGNPMPNGLKRKQSNIAIEVDEMDDDDAVKDEGHKLKKLSTAVLLLQFLESLEKLMYNAFEGSAVSLPQASRAIRTFFRTNRATCHEWLSRIREYATRLAMLTGCSTSAVRHGFAWLQGLRDSGSMQGAEFERAVVTVVESLCQLHAWEAVAGVLEWSKKHAGRNFFWLVGAVAKAKGSYERAADQFKTGLDKYLSPDRQKNEHAGEQKKSVVTVLTKEPVIHADAYVTQYLASRAVECYVKLGDWSEVQQWSQRVKEMRKRLSNIDGLQANVDLNYVRMMTKFEEHDFSGVREQLELIPGATISNIVQEQFPVLGAAKEEKEQKSSPREEVDAMDLRAQLEESWRPSALLTRSQIYLMRALTLYWTSGLNTLKGSRVGSLHSTSWETVEDLLSLAQETASTAVRACLLNDSPTASSPYLMQLKSVSALKGSLLATEDEETQDYDCLTINVSGKKVYLDPNRTDIQILNQALRAASYLQFHHSLHKKGWVAPAVTSAEKIPNMASLQVLSAKLARKQGNIKLSEALLAKQLSWSENRGSLETKMIPIGNAQLKLRQLSSSAHTGKVTDPLAAVEILKESAKLKRVLGNSADGTDTLCTSILLAERQSNIQQKSVDMSRLAEVSARSMLTLTRWLLSEPKLLNSTPSETEDNTMIGVKLREILKVIVKSGGLSTKMLQNAAASVLAMPECDKICGQFLHYSTHKSPQLAKAWFAYADWCYKWGRKAVEHTSMNGKIELSDEERDHVVRTLPEGTPKEDVESIISVLNKGHCTRTSSPEEDISTSELSENPNEDDEENTRRQLLIVCPCLQDQPKRLETLISIWRAIVDRVFSHYKLAIGAYFTYLRLGGGEVESSVTTKSEHGNITATLRLLRLLVKYSGELKQELETHLDQTPTKPWKGIIPQLFARLNHPESYVQQSVSNLISRIAKDSPHLIVYPTVVGCSDTVPAQLSKSSAAGILRGYKLMKLMNVSDQSQNALDDANEIQTETETESEVVTGPDSQEEQSNETLYDQVLQSSLHNIQDNLSEDNPLLVCEVQKVVRELRRITLLWDELWIGSLLQLHHEAQRRIQQLEEEIKRVNSNQTLSSQQKQLLIKEKHSALMKPLVYSLERLEKITSQDPETPHEKSFQKAFGAGIQQSIEKLKNPSDPSNPQANWEPLKQLHSSLQARSQKRSLNSLFMEEISPILAKSKFSLLPMPGIDFTADQVVTLESFSNDVVILPTKTKPKKLLMIGSDGQRYNYLFKGLEDLHLDERIMQFLEICNHMFAREEKSDERKYVARRYSVTPLGPRSGLIQWVDGATPIFALYKRWQQREIAAQSLVKATQGEKTVTSHAQAPLRPSEVFYNKITPLLKEKGVTDLASSRKEWPISVLREVLAELIKDTPGDLIAKELWCSTTTASDWWEVTQTYARSMAVMSVIGYVIGLGDRHLDNILVDLSTGEVVHIDYNVCFEKGKALRVPEKVPFRMTQNLENALGVTGVEGLFRLSCEKVLQILRHGRETLLTLLEAFVYDPLVDWTTANDAAFAGAFYGGGAGGDEGNRFSKKEMERGITQTLLSTRVAEMKVSWSSNRDELVSAFSKLESSLESYCSTLSQQQSTRRDVSNLQHQHDLLKAALDRTDHPLHTLQARYDKQAKLLEELKTVKQRIQEKLNECEQFHKQHKLGFAKVRGKDVAQLYSEVCKLAEIGTPSYGPAINFLQSAGQSTIISQCKEIENELTQLLNQRRSALRASLDIVHSYSAVTSQFPDDYPEQTWCGRWIPWLEKLIEDPASTRCDVILKDHDAVIQGRVKLSKENEGTVSSMEVKLNQYFTEQNTKLVKFCERRNQEALETSALSGPVTETWNALRKFIGDSGVPGATSLACVTITALSTLNKRHLVMENAATVAGERLMHLTSRDGDWFLDELCTMCGNIAQLLSVLKNNPLRPSPKNIQKQETMEHINNCMQVTFAAVKVYSSLQELMTNFRTIIVPEAIKGIQNEDPTVLEMIEGLRQLISGSPIQVQKLVETLQNGLKKEEKQAQTEACHVLQELRYDLEKITEPEEESDNEKEEETSSTKMTPGQMLLAGFSGLFMKVEAELSVLHDAFKKLHHVEGIEHVDLFQEQKNLKMSKKMSSLPSNHCLSLLFARRLQVIQGFFNACIQQAGATKDLRSDTYVMCNGVDISKDDNLEPISDTFLAGKKRKTLRVFNEELLSLPVKQFIAECVQQCIVGIPSQSLTQLIVHFINLLHSSLGKELREGKKGSMTVEELCKKVVEHNLKTSAFPHQHLGQASSLINAHDVAWRKHDLARRLDAAIASQKDVLHRAQLQLACFQWLHEDTLCFAGSGRKHTIPMANPSRASIIADIKKRLHSIGQVEYSIANVVERYAQLESSIEQRLKWAAGANPALHTVLQNFDQAVIERKQMLITESKLTPEVKGLANTIVRLETFRNSNAEATAFDASVVSIVQRCKECCDNLEATTGELGDVEQLMNNLQIPIPPKEPITSDWMKSRVESIEKQLKVLKSKEHNLYSGIGHERESLKSKVGQVKGVLTGHHNLVGDVKSLLKTLAKDEEAPECMTVRNFIAGHNRFSEEASVVLKKIVALSSSGKVESEEKDVPGNEKDSPKELVEKIKEMTKSAHWLHDHLLAFGSSSLIEDKQTGAKTFASALRRQSLPKAGEVAASGGIVASESGPGPPKDPNVSPTVMSPSAKQSLLAPSPRRNQTGLARDPKTGKALQEKNLYAVNVWRRVKAKLEGRDADLNHRMTVVEQADFVIQEAINADNLCQLYEGWTPWV